MRPSLRLAVLAMLALALLPAALSAAPAAASLVADVTPGGDSLSWNNSAAAGAPRRFTTMGGVTYFIATDQANGRELWRTDGTAQGTRIVRDSSPGIAPTFNGDSSDSELEAVGSTLYFAQNDTLWRSDGTELGTTPVIKLFPQLYSSSGPPAIEDLTASGGRLFFSARDINLAVTSLYVTDGTAAGTLKLKELNPLAVETLVVDVGGAVFFTTNNQVWRSDGTVAGTALVRDAIPNGLWSFGGRAIWAESPAGALWSSDGTPGGAQQLSETSSWMPVPAGGVFFFVGTRGGVTGIYRSDGTAAGTSLVTSAVAPDNLAAAGSNLFYIALGQTPGTYALWRLGQDGSAPASLVEGAPGTYPTTPVPFGAQVALALERGADGSELWMSDGTVQGTRMVRDIRPGPGANPGSGAGSIPTELFDAGGALFFAANDGVHAKELWRSDGTEAGTALVRDIHAGWNDTSAAGSAAAGGLYYFVRQAAPSGSGLWRSDGTAQGTFQLQASDGSALSAPVLLTPAGSTLYFVDGRNGGAVWKTDGTSAGTILLTDFASEPSRFARPRWLTPALGKLFFAAAKNDRYRELWVSDGTPQGTSLVKDVGDASSFTNISYLTEFAGKLFFVASDGVTGRELWSTDGTPQGTAQVLDLRPGAAGSDPQSLQVVGDALVFSAADAGGVQRLWRSDGTAAGTTPIAPSGSESLTVGTSVVSGGRLFWIGFLGAGGPALWVSDGTSGGTALLKSITPGSSLAPLGGGVIFSAEDAGGYEPWFSDGTAAGTARMLDLAPGPAGGVASQFYSVGARGLAYFAGVGAGGVELWQTDGSAAGTVRIADVAPGASSAAPSDMAAAAGRLFFFANDDAHGRELWSIPMEQAPGNQRALQPGTAAALRFGDVTLDVPAGAVSSPVTLMYAAGAPPQEEAGFQFAGRSFDLTAYQGGAPLATLSFAAPVRLVVRYSDADIAGLDESRLVLRYRAAEGWVDAATTCAPAAAYERDPAANTLVVSICHLSEYALFGAVDRTVYLPLTMR